MNPASPPDWRIVWAHLPTGWTYWVTAWQHITTVNPSPVHGCVELMLRLLTEVDLSPVDRAEIERVLEAGLANLARDDEKR